MGTSKNDTIQDLMSQVDSLDVNDSSLESKLNEIARLVQAEQQKMKNAFMGNTMTPSIVGDPADDFACDSCQ